MMRHTLPPFSLARALARSAASSTSARSWPRANPTVLTPNAGSVLSIFLKSSTEQHQVKGAVLHGDAPRLLQIDGIDVEAPLGRSLIYLRNRDVPGVIGKVGTILGDEAINIADFSLGRPGADAADHASEHGSEHPREAIAVVHVDGIVPEAVLEKLRKIPAVKTAKAVRQF